jgi:paraquat-inducible protein A
MPPRQTALPRPSTETVSPDTDVAATLVLCSDCDALQLAPKAVGWILQVRCLRCGAELPSIPGTYLEQGSGPPLLFLLLGTTMLVLVAALTLPILIIEESGNLVTVNVWGTIAAFQTQHLTPLAALMGVTTAVFPILELACLSGLLAGVNFAGASSVASRLARVVGLIRPWCQLDVLCVALLIAARKLAGPYQVRLGLAVPCLALVLFVDRATAPLIRSEVLWRRLMGHGRDANTGQASPW